MTNAEHLDDTQSVVPLNDFILQRYGVALDRDAEILDFGCGSGRHTYEYLDAGYRNVTGFDIRDYVKLRHDDDRKRFRFAETGEDFRLPFPDNAFDFIGSTAVFEHVQDQAEAIAEIARVLKPGGATLHVFPSRWRPLETHIYVPFGGAIQARGWLSLWARLGVRNEFQRDLDAAAVTERNIRFCANDIAYPPAGEIKRNWRAAFDDVVYAEDAFIDGSRGASTISRVAFPIVKAFPPALALYRAAHTRAILARAPRLPS